ncbi:MAG: hypothetical protein BAA02_06480 [Paenibacillaceae bacterium ZCTH02-B3]|nr:MAG: hypothetical protein BAA02_06480 [Paenibacillaceae bacterium ZCTH02-B3]
MTSEAKKKRYGLFSREGKRVFFCRRCRIMERMGPKCGMKPKKAGMKNGRMKKTGRAKQVR